MERGRGAQKIIFGDGYNDDEVRAAKVVMRNEWEWRISLNVNHAVAE